MSLHLLLGATGVAQPGAVVSLSSSNSSVLVQIKLKAKSHGRGWQRQPGVIAEPNSALDKAKLCQKAKLYKTYHLFPSSKENRKRDSETEGLVSVFVILTNFNHL